MSTKDTNIAKILGEGAVKCLTTLLSSESPLWGLVDPVIDTVKELRDFGACSNRISFSDIENICKTIVPDHIAQYRGIVSVATDICLKETDFLTNPYEPKDYSQRLAIDYGSNANTEFEFMKIAQFRLSNLGYNCGTLDGKQGNVTDAKIKQFQTAKGYTDDGIIGATTWNSLLPQVKGGNVNDAVRFLRIRLTARGYSELGTSTTFDSTLENKVKHFQTSAGLTSDGIVGMNAWRKLG